MDAVRMVTEEAVSLGKRLELVTVDDTGLGGGVTDRLRELGYPVLAVNFAAKAGDQNHFKNIRDEMYWCMRELFRSDEIAIPNNEELITQLAGVRYKAATTGQWNKITIETKDEMKKRGMKSPDHADSLALAVYGARRLTGSSFTRRRVSARNQSEAEQYY
jgi:transposase